MKEIYNGYKLQFYPKNGKLTHFDRDRYCTFKARPYDDADYYWAYTYDKTNWVVVYKGKITQRFVGTFHKVVDLIESRNQNIKPIMVHW